MVEKCFYEETEAGGGLWKTAESRRGAFGDYELMTAPQYFGKWLVDENKWRRVK